MSKLWNYYHWPFINWKFHYQILSKIAIETTPEMVKDGVCIIDVGITRIRSDKTKSGWKLLGDVSYNEVKDKCSFITPVPGGVGPMTIAMLLRNTLIASKSKSNS